MSVFDSFDLYRIKSENNDVLYKVSFKLSEKIGRYTPTSIRHLMENILVFDKLTVTLYKEYKKEIKKINYEELLFTKENFDYPKVPFVLLLRR